MSLPPDDLSIPDYLYDTLPNAITLFHCNNRLLSKCFDLVSIHSPTQSGSKHVVSMPGDTRFRKRIGEVCLDLDILSETSDQWLIEVKKHFAVKPSQQPSQQMHSKTNFAILDDRGVVLTSLTKSTLQPTHFIQQQNINTTQLFSNNHFHFLDITKTKQDFPTSKYMAICQYANHLGTVNGQYHGKLMLIPLNIFGTRELVQEKFSAVPPDEVVIDHTRIGKHRRIGLVPQNLNQTKMNSESTSKYFHSLTHQEPLVIMHDHKENIWHTIRHTG